MGLCGMINLDKVKNHPHDIASEMEKQLANKARYFIFDVLDNQDLLTVARATANFLLVTGAAGLGYAIATRMSRTHCPENRPCTLMPADPAWCFLAVVPP